jgi:hypothetical protein
MRVRRATILAAAAFGALAASAQASNRSFEAESMVVDRPGAVVADSRASGGRAVELAPGGSARLAVTTAAPAYWLSLRATGSNCFGASTIDVYVDGALRYSGAVPSSGYGLVEAWLPSIRRGTHTVEAKLRDGGGLVLGCRPSARIDRVTVHAPFADDSFRNRPLRRDARIASSSRRLVASLRRQALVSPGKVWVNTSDWSVPLYIVPHDQPPAVIESPTWEVEKQLRGAPLPPNARPADPPDGDHELSLYQPATDTLWDLHYLRRVSGGPRPRWVAAWGGRMRHVSESPGYFTNARGRMTFGASASRLTLFGGLQTIEELEAGRIDHAVDLVLPNVAQGRFVWPAQDSDDEGHAIGPDPVPEGTRFRLPASLDVDTLGLPPYTRMLAKAIQRYGAVVRDRGGVVSFKAEDPRPRGTDPYSAIFGGQYPDQDHLFARFPWRKLQVVAPQRK